MGPSGCGRRRGGSCRPRRGRSSGTGVARTRPRRRRGGRRLEPARVACMASGACAKNGSLMSVLGWTVSFQRCGARLAEQASTLVMSRTVIPRNQTELKIENSPSVSKIPGPAAVLRPERFDPGRVGLRVALKPGRRLDQHRADESEDGQGEDQHESRPHRDEEVPQPLADVAGRDGEATIEVVGRSRIGTADASGRSRSSTHLLRNRVVRTGSTGGRTCS